MPEISNTMGGCMRRSAKRVHHYPWAHHYPICGGSVHQYSERPFPHQQQRWVPLFIPVCFRMQYERVRGQEEMRAVEERGECGESRQRERLRLVLCRAAINAIFSLKYAGYLFEILTSSQGQPAQIWMARAIGLSMAGPEHR
ncbi:hypothetical protein BDZ91DRAFT_765215 [Kalaharituber pfeilii]|nr:hypothetical protein BDZ91DRAFT_765215 [Kalaharituber pfeilii]